MFHDFITVYTEPFLDELTLMMFYFRSSANHSFPLLYDHSRKHHAFYMCLLISRICLTFQYLGYVLHVYELSWILFIGTTSITLL